MMKKGDIVKNTMIHKNPSGVVLGECPAYHAGTGPAVRVFSGGRIQLWDGCHLQIISRSYEKSKSNT